jgi:hypothetical protein
MATIIIDQIVVVATRNNNSKSNYGNDNKAITIADQIVIAVTWQ